jgi:hypothetical protein
MENLHWFLNLGFEGDRSAAVKALYFTSQSNDIRSAYADLILCMYSTVSRQLCGYSEVDMHLSYKVISYIHVFDFNKKVLTL